MLAWHVSEIGFFGRRPFTTLYGSHTLAHSFLSRVHCTCTTLIFRDIISELYKEWDIYQVSTYSVVCIIVKKEATTTTKTTSTTSTKTPTTMAMNARQKWLHYIRKEYAESGGRKQMYTHRVPSICVIVITFDFLSVPFRLTAAAAATAQRQ